MLFVSSSNFPYVTFFLNFSITLVIELQLHVIFVIASQNRPIGSSDCCSSVASATKNISEYIKQEPFDRILIMAVGLLNYQI